MATSAINTYIQHLYNTILQRTGETAGIDYWVSVANAGMSAAQMTQNFIASSEARNVISVLHLYDAFFNRAADSSGLAYWVTALNSGVSLSSIAESFGASSEFQAKFAGTSNADYVEALYNNLFGRGSDAAGKAYWLQQIDNGVLSHAAVALSFSLSDEALSSTGAATRFTESYLVLRAAGNAEPSTSDVTALALKDLATALAEKITSYDVGTIFNVTGGKLADGYLQGATIFADANGDGVWNEGEATTTTDAFGNFNLTGAKGALIASGGIDLSTGKAFKGVLKATAGSTNINPLTTLQQAFVEKGLSVTDAQAKVAHALGLDTSKFDLTTFDPVATAMDTSASAADRALGVQLQAQAAKIANFIVAASQTLIGAAGGADKLDAHTAGQALLDAVVNAIETDSDKLLRFSDDGMLQSILKESVTLSGNASLMAEAAKVASMADAFAAISAAAANNVDRTLATGGDVVETLINITQTQVVVQGNMADKLLLAANSGNLAVVESAFTGAAFDTAAQNAILGELDPNSTADDSAVAASNAAARAATEPPPPITDTTAPTLTSSSPADGNATFVIGNNLTLTFNETVALGTGNIVLKASSGDSVVESFNVATGVGSAGGTVTVSGATVTIDPFANLSASTDYNVRVDATAVVDTANNAYAGIADATTLNFTTAAPVFDGTLRTTSANDVAAANAYLLGGAVTLTLDLTDPLYRNHSNISLSNFGTDDFLNIKLQTSLFPVIAGWQKQGATAHVIGTKSNAYSVARYRSIPNSSTSLTLTRTVRLTAPVADFPAFSPRQISLKSWQTVNYHWSARFFISGLHISTVGHIAFI